METSTIEIIKKLKELNLSLFTLADFGRLFNIKELNTLYKKIQRLEKRGIVKKLIKGKYQFLMQEINDFLMANFLYQPSYISLESALSFYGIITGFPYQITSMTIKKTKNFIIKDKEYSYSKIDNNLFWGYEKKEDFLIAEREKAVFDYLYLATKGLKSKDFDEWDLSGINKKKLKEFLQRSGKKGLLRFSQRLL